jgi:hypothetical protein
MPPKLSASTPTPPPTPNPSPVSATTCSKHRAAVQQQLVQQEADGLRRLNLDREKVMDRLWEIANLSPDMTRGSITGQVKALSMIVAMQNLIPDRRAISSEKKSPPAPAEPQIYPAAWRAPHQATTNNPQPSPAQKEARQQDSPGATLANRFTLSKAPERSVPLFASVPDLGVRFPIKNPFVHPR